MTRRLWTLTLSLCSLIVLAGLLIIASCSSSAKVVNKAKQTQKLTARLIELARTVQAAPAGTTQLSGDCPTAPGTLTFTNFSGQGASGGTVSGTISFHDYCSVDQTTSNKTTINGDVPFAISKVTSGGTVSISRVTANAPLLTIVKKSPAGQSLESTSLGIAGFSYTPGNPATSTNPTVIAFTELSVQSTAGAQSRSLMLRDVSVQQAPTTGGGSTISASGRLYRGESGYTDFSTPTPLSFNSSNAPATGGQVVFTGANNTNATLTVTSAAPVAMSVSVNGTPLSSQLSCSSVTLPTLP